MDRLGFQDGEDSIPGTVWVHLQFIADTDGAIPSTLTLDKFISSVTLSTNDYIVAFQDSYYTFVNGFGFIIQATPDPTSAAFQVKPTAVSVDDSTPTVTLTPFDEAGTPIHLATGDTLYFSFLLSRQSPNT